MIVGDTRVFAIESGITDAFQRPFPSALGYFIIHVCGQTYGVKKDDASMLACSFDEVERRLRQRGAHVPPVKADVAAVEFATAYLDAIYRDTSRTDYFGLCRSDFAEALQTNGVIWAPDGDEAFDDGSHVLQFDAGNRVRIVAFRNLETPEGIRNTISEEWIDTDLFYGILSCWRTLFSTELLARLKAKQQ